MKEKANYYFKLCGNIADPIEIRFAKMEINGLFPGELSEIPNFVDVLAQPPLNPIVIQHSIGSIRDEELNAVLQDRLKVPHDRQRTPMYKFIRAEPPVLYTATVLWRILMVFHKPFQSQFTVPFSIAH